MYYAVVWPVPALKLRAVRKFLFVQTCATKVSKKIKIEEIHAIKR